MAGPVSGIGGQQQVPLSQPFQPGGDQDAVRESEDRQPEENTVQPQGAAAAETQNTETDNDQILQAQTETALTPNLIEEPVVQQERGSIVDIEV